MALFVGFCGLLWLADSVLVNDGGGMAGAGMAFMLTEATIVYC
jgi:hypothetical protein